MRPVVGAAHEEHHATREEHRLLGDRPRQVELDGLAASGASLRLGLHLSAGFRLGATRGLGLRPCLGSRLRLGRCWLSGVRRLQPFGVAKAEQIGRLTLRRWSARAALAVSGELPPKACGGVDGQDAARDGDLGCADRCCGERGGGAAQGDLEPVERQPVLVAAPLLARIHRVEEQRLGDALERARLHLLCAVPHDEVTRHRSVLLEEDCRPQRLRTFELQRLQVAPAMLHAPLVHEDQRLLLGERATDLGEARAREEVTSRHEDEHHCRLTHVLLDHRDVVEIVDVEEDPRRRQHQTELPLDDRDLVLPGLPRVRHEQMVDALRLWWKHRRFACLPKVEHASMGVFVSLGHGAVVNGRADD